MNFGAPVVYMFLRRYPAWLKLVPVMGYIFLLISLIGASFATTVPQLLATQGVLSGLGGCLNYYPTFVWIDSWFVARRGLAYGIAWGGSAAAGVVAPLAMQWMLTNWGFRITLRVWAVVSMVLMTPALVLAKSRVPVRQDAAAPRHKMEVGFLRSPAFLTMQTANVLVHVGLLMPNLYLPSFAVSQGWSAVSGTVAISVINGATVLGSMMVGWLTDRYHAATVMNLCAAGAVSAVFIFWTLAVHQPAMYVFSALYGVFAGSYPSTWAGCAGPIRRNYPGVETGMMLALFVSGRGLGTVLGGPISGALVKSDVWKDHAALAYGSGFGGLIVCSGVTASFMSLPWLAKQFGIL